MNTRASSLRRVRILVNRRSGFMWSFETVRKAFDEYWDIPEDGLSSQFCKDAEDGRIKALRAAAEQGVDVLLVVGGDGTISTTGAALIGTRTISPQ